MLATGTALALGAALGAAKYASDSESAQRQRKLQGQIATYSPWTGFKPTAVADPNAFGDILQGTASIGSLNQGLSAAAPAAGATATTPGPNASMASNQFHLLSPDQLAVAGAAQGSPVQSPWNNFGSFNSPYLASR